MSLQGNLADLPFEDLLGLATRRDNRAVLRISNLLGATTKAIVYIANRELYAAWLYQTSALNEIVTIKRGEEVIYYLFSCTEAQFCFEVLAETETLPTRNINSSIREILLANVFRSQDTVVQTLAMVQSIVAQNLTTSPKQYYEPSSVTPLPSFAPTRVAVGVSQAQLTQPSAVPKRRVAWFSSLVARLTQL
jgi:hypothetical protein